MTNEQYVEMAEAIYQKDLQLAKAALDVIKNYETCMAEAVTQINEFVSGMPNVAVNNKTTIRSAIDSAMSQLTNSNNQLTYVKSLLAGYNTVATPPAPQN